MSRIRIRDESGAWIVEAFMAGRWAIVGWSLYHEMARTIMHEIRNHTCRLDKS